MPGGKKNRPANNGRAKGPIVVNDGKDHFYRHPGIDEAIAEAERLAQNTGSNFTVYVAVAAVRARPFKQQKFPFITQRLEDRIEALRGMDAAEFPDPIIPPPAPEFNQQRNLPELTFEVEPQLTGYNRNQLKAQIVEAIESAREPQRVIIDFKNTAYIDASGLGVLVSVAKKIKQQNGDLRIRGLNDEMRELFRLTTLDKLIPVEDQETVNA